jgi:hypothetical protein
MDLHEGLIWAGLTDVALVDSDRAFAFDDSESALHSPSPDCLLLMQEGVKRKT